MNDPINPIDGEELLVGLTPLPQHLMSEQELRDWVVKQRTYRDSQATVRAVYRQAHIDKATSVEEKTAKAAMFDDL